MEASLCCLIDSALITHIHKNEQKEPNKKVIKTTKVAKKFRRGFLFVY